MISFIRLIDSRGPEGDSRGCNPGFWLDAEDRPPRPDRAGQGRHRLASHLHLNRTTADENACGQFCCPLGTFCTFTSLRKVGALRLSYREYGVLIIIKRHSAVQNFGSLWEEAGGGSSQLACICTIREGAKNRPSTENQVQGLTPSSHVGRQSVCHPSPVDGAPPQDSRVPQSSWSARLWQCRLHTMPPLCAFPN